MPPHNPDTRSGFGDNHAATEDAMMAAHASHILKAGLIDEKMEKELSKPRRNHRAIEIEYTSAYLSKLPTYTGQNHEDMPTLEIALQRQAERDKAQLKLLADYSDGKIDIHGHPIAAWHTGDRNATADTESQGQRPAKRRRSMKQPKSTPITTNMDGNPTVTERKGETTATASLSSLKQRPAKRERTTKQPNPTPLTSSSPTPASDQSWRIIAPLVPLPGHPNYAEIRYYQLAALCRERSLPGRGNEQEVRNRLIRDDINIAEGQLREIVNNPKRKRKYKHVAPENVGAESGKSVRGAKGEKKNEPEETVTAEST